MTTEVSARRFRLASPATALVLGGLVLALMVALVPLGDLSHQGLSTSGGSAFLAPVFGVVGFVVAWRRPGNPLGWLMLGAAGFLVLSGDAGAYAVADYRLHHGRLPFGWVAVLLQPGWAPAIAFFGLAVLLFPDGRVPSPRWRWVLWVYGAVAGAWVAGVVFISAGAIIGHNVHVAATGDLLLLDRPTGSAAWWGAVQAVFFPLLGVFWLATLVGQALSYRRSSGERRQQLKWLVGGSAVAIVGGALGVPLSDNPRIPQIVGGLGIVAVLALPVSMGVAILKYRLYDIDRLISRTLAYAIVTGLLVGVYAGLVLLATRVLPFSSPVAVAGSTLVAAALFTPLRRRVQRIVDRRFNRARYDADRMVASFAARLTEATDLGAVRDDLAGMVRASLEPSHVSVWIKGAER